MGGEGVQYQLQGVIYDMGNATMSGEVMYGWIERPDTPIVGMKELLAGLNIERFCWSSKGLGESAISFYIGCLLVSVGQALMASSLHGERERVMVHEHEDVGGHQPSYPYIAGSSAPLPFNSFTPSRSHTLALAPADYSPDLKDTRGDVELF